MNNNPNDITNMPYAQWLEESLQRISSLPIRALVMIGITEDGNTYNDYYNATMADKLVIAGLIQQDAMLDTLEMNGLIASTGEEDTDGEEE